MTKNTEKHSAMPCGAPTTRSKPAIKSLARSAILVLCAVMMLASAGCAAKPVTNPDRQDVILQDETEPLGGFLNLNGAEEEEPLLADGPMTNYLLYGYNVLDDGYIDSKSIDKSNPIIDKTKLESSEYENVTNTSSDVDYMFSNTVSDFYSSLNVSAKSKYKGVFFSGSIKTDYSIAKSLHEQQTLIKYIQYHQTAEQYYTVSVSALKKKLTQDFLDDVKAYAVSNPKKIFDTYGTHLIKQYFLGGRAELNFLYRNTSQQTKESLEVNVQAAYKSFSGKVDAKTDKQAKVVTEHSSMSFRSKGGDNLTGNSPSDISGKYDAWVKSIASKPAISGIADFDKALLPIWELVDDKAAAESLEKKFNALAKTAQGKLLSMDPTAMYITEIGVYSEPESKDALKEIPNGFVKVMLNPGTDSAEVMDANKGAGGDYIYIAYKLSADPTNAITDIKLAVGDSSSASINGYKKINVDLNHNAGGKFIYLCYKTATTKDEPCLKEIRGVYTSTENSYTLPSWWEWVSNRADLNKGSGGKFIYLAMRREVPKPDDKK